jgi:hypothetical protein
LNKKITSIITYTVGGLGSGKTTSIDCALVRPFRQFLEDKKSIGKITYVLLFQGGVYPSHILGSFCYTHGNRLLFFPGLVQRNVRWANFKSFKNVEGIGSIDHVTLEEHNKSGHFTILEQGKKIDKKLWLPNFKTNDKTTYFWFGLSVMNIGVFEQTPEQYSVGLSYDVDDDKNITALIMEAVKSQKQQVLRLNKVYNKESYLHFEFLFGPKDLDISKLTLNLPPNVSISNPSQILTEGLPITAYPIEIEGIKGTLWITVVGNIGKISEKAIFSFSLN